MNVVAYVRERGARAQYRVKCTKDKGSIVAFVVQLETLRDEKWVPVARYDTAHGFAHLDQYRADGSVRRHQRLDVTDFNAAFTLAVMRVRDHWKELIREFGEVT